MGDSALWLMTGAQWVNTMCVVFAGTILITYSTCLHNGYCGGLPLWSGPWDSISHSWEEFPGESHGHVYV